MIVALEGIDRSGKSTAALKLTEYLKAKLFKFPDKTSPTGELIYAHLQKKWSAEPAIFQASNENEQLKRNHLDALVFQSLQLANRMEAASEIMEAAAQGNVVFDRYWASGYAYGRADGLDSDYLVKLHAWLPQPDLWILVDCDSVASFARGPKERDRYEEDAGYLNRVAENYRELWKLKVAKHPLQWQFINGRLAPELVWKQVEAAVEIFKFTQTPEGAAYFEAAKLNALDIEAAWHLERKKPGEG